MKRIAIVMIAALAAHSAFSDETWTDTDTGFTWSYFISGNEATVTGISPTSGEMPPIPSELGGKPVTAIGGGAFFGCSGLTGALILPDSVVAIGNGAFEECGGITQVIIPSGVTTIQCDAFRNCISLTGVYVNDIMSWMNVLVEEGEGSNPLQYAHNLYIDGIKVEGKLVLPDGVERVCNFYGCTGLTEVEMPNSVTNIGDQAFKDCTELVNMNMPTSIKVIGEYAFSGCRKLLKLEWPAGVAVGAYAFQNCSSWQGVFNVPDGVTEIAAGMFFGCSGLRQINMPDGITTIGELAFRECSSLMEMRLPLGLTEISDGMFWECSNLSRVTIPNTVRRIGSYAFCLCSKLTSVEVPEGVSTLGELIFWNGGYPFYMGGVRNLILPSTLVNVDTAAFVLSYPETITFAGDLPVGYERWEGIDGVNVSFARASGGRGLVTWPVTQFMGYTQTNAPTVTIVSSKIRENDPEVMDVVYRVNSTKPTVKVRALAFEDGERSFAKVVRAENFVADLNGNETSGNVGDAITANEEHTLSWKVSADWATRLAKVSFEVLATEDDILPLELMTIPGTAVHPETWQVSWNYVTSDKSFEALLWLYADRDLGLTLEDGVLKNGSTRLCEGAAVSAYDALVYIYGKMGFQLLDGDSLDYDAA